MKSGEMRGGSTLRQKILAKKVVEAYEKGYNKSQKELLLEAGFSEQTSDNPKVVFGYKGFQRELAKLGFSIDAADKTVQRLLVSAEKEETQLKAADMIYKRLGGYAPEKTVNLSIKGDVKEFEQFAALREKYEAELYANIIEKDLPAPGEVDSNVNPPA